ncbi:LamG-like jellyroll fold domain-containing protein [Saccharicrinis sp. FJH62]|uniref:LamG-like jellyroll fold domain-containing protein n=1 Tax=Saccharicrinis sp. FJH62 TaxID=3344657 RepID=UPI0035D4CF92
MKKNVLLFAFILLMGQLATAQDYHWPLKTDLSDVAGGLDGTNHGVTFVDDAVKGPVAYFDGDSYANLPGFVNGLTEITISMWFRMDELRVWSRIYSFGHGDQTEPKDVLMVIPTSGALDPDTQDNMYRFTLSVPDDTWYDLDFFHDEVAIELDTWYLSTVVLKPDSIIIYHNDEQIFAESGFPRAFGTIEDTENALGKSFWPDLLWKGALSDLQVWKRGLSKSEVMDIYNGTSTAVKHTQSNNINIYSVNKQIRIDTNPGANVAVYNIAGALIAQKPAEEIQKMTFRSGVYLVQVETADKQKFTEKLLIK